MEHSSTLCLSAIFDSFTALSTSNSSRLDRSSRQKTTDTHTQAPHLKMTSLLHRRIESWTSPYRAYRERRKSSRVAPAQTKIEGVDFVDHSKTQSQVKTEEISVASSRSFPAATHSKPSPTTQRALVVASKGTYALLDTYPVPRLLHEKEVIIKSCAVGLNAIDWKSVDYNFCLPEFPWITGREMAGVVEKVGDEVTDFKVGDKVWTSELIRTQLLLK